MHCARSRSLALLFASATAGSLLSGCALFDGGSDLDNATDYLPANTTNVEFFDRQAMAERTGVDDIDPRKPSDADLDDYVDAVVTVPWGTNLFQYLSVAADAPLHEFDIRWYAAATFPVAGDDTGLAWLYKVDDDLDLDAFTDHLLDSGYAKSRTSGFDTYTAGEESLGENGVLADYYPLSFHSVLVVPDENLIATSALDASLEPVAAAIADDADSLADDPADLEPLLDDAGDAEYARLVTGTATCGAVLDTGTPEGDAALADQYDDLGVPRSRSVVVEVEKADGSDKLLAHSDLLFGDDDAAESDLIARKALISDGFDPVSQRPMSDLGDFSVDRDDSIVTVQGSGTDEAIAMVRGMNEHGGPALCWP